MATTATKSSASKAAKTTATAEKTPPAPVADIKETPAAPVADTKKAPIPPKEDVNLQRLTGFLKDVKHINSKSGYGCKFHIGNTASYTQVPAVRDANGEITVPGVYKDFDVFPDYCEAWDNGTTLAHELEALAASTQWARVTVWGRYVGSSLQTLPVTAVDGTVIERTSFKFRRLRVLAWEVRSSEILEASGAADPGNDEDFEPPF